MPKRKSPPARLNRRDALKLLGTGLAAGLFTLRGADRAGLGHDVRADEQLIPSRPNLNWSLLPSDNLNAPRPNLVVVASDNHHYRTMNFAGHPFVETPALDRLASEGVVFENAFCTTPLCSPSRASLLTGVYAHRHGVYHNHTPWTGEYPTFLEPLSQVGYATAFIGKWHMPGKGLPDLPFLDRFISYTYREGQGSYYHCPLVVDGQAVAGSKTYLTTLLTDYAIEFIQENQRQNRVVAPDQARPFCLYLSQRACHPPYQAPPELAGFYRKADVKGYLPPQIDPWWYGKANRNMFEGVLFGSYTDQYRKYCETLTALDRELLRLLETLDRLELSRNTVVIYISDNGMQWGTHDRHGIREPYEDSIRLPWIVRAPELIPDAGTRRSQMALNLDLAPTLLDLAGVATPTEVDGQSLVPYLANPRLPGREAFQLEFWRYFPENTPSYRGARTERYKFIEFERGRKPWIFDLQNDPGEMNNLYGQAEGRRLQALLGDMLRNK